MAEAVVLEEAARAGAPAVVAQVVVVVVRAGERAEVLAAEGAGPAEEREAGREAVEPVAEREAVEPVAEREAGAERRTRIGTIPLTASRGPSCRLFPLR